MDGREPSHWCLFMRQETTQISRNKTSYQQLFNRMSYCAYLLRIYHLELVYRLK